MQTRSTALLVLAATPILTPSVAVAAEQEQRSTLTRVREGGTPYDPNQSLVPYAIDLSGTRGVPTGAGAFAAPNPSLVSSPPEYSPTRGVLFQYGNSWNSVVTACVGALTAGTVNDEIAYVVVANQATATSAASAFTAAGANLSKVGKPWHAASS